MRVDSFTPFKFSIAAKQSLRAYFTQNLSALYAFFTPRLLASDAF